MSQVTLRFDKVQICMGMDAVQIVMDIEDHFGISIDDHEAQSVRTVGDLITIVHARILTAEQVPCPALNAFASLRHLVREVANDATLRVRPRNDVAAILTPPQRRALWRVLPGLFGRDPPPLRRPVTLRLLLQAALLGSTTLAFWAALRIDLAILPVTLLVALAAMAVIHFATRPLRSVAPAGWETFGQITGKIVQRTVATKQLALRTHDQVLDELRPLLQATLRVDCAKIVPNARLIEDLGMS